MLSIARARRHVFANSKPLSIAFSSEGPRARGLSGGSSTH